MLLRNFNLILTPTRRVGGTSVSRALDRFYSEPGDSERFNLGVLSGSEYGKKYPAHGSWISEVTNGPYRSFLKVLMVRNPFEKLVSAYTALSALNRLSNRTFREFVLQRSDLRPSSDDIWVWDHTWRTLAELSVLDGVFVFDDLIRFEKLNSDFERVCAATGLPAVNLPHLRATVHEEYRTYYDAETTAIVAEHFAEDLRLFGYSFNDGGSPS